MTQGIFMYGLINLILGMAAGALLMWLVLKPKSKDDKLEEADSK